MWGVQPQAVLHYECLGPGDQLNGSLSVCPLMVHLVWVDLCFGKWFGFEVEAEICLLFFPLVWEDGKCNLKY